MISTVNLDHYNRKRNECRREKVVLLYKGNKIHEAPDWGILQKSFITSVGTALERENQTEVRRFIKWLINWSVPLPTAISLSMVTVLYQPSKASIGHHTIKRLRV